MLRPADRQITLYVRAGDEPMWDRLRELAPDRGLSQIVAEAVREWLEKHDTK